jgi:hypothetical protein
MNKHAQIPLLFLTSTLAIADVPAGLACLPHQQMVVVAFAIGDDEVAQASVCTPKKFSTGALRTELQAHLSAAAGAEVRLLRVELLLDDEPKVSEVAFTVDRQ